MPTTARPLQAFVPPFAPSLLGSPRPKAFLQRKLSALVLSFALSHTLAQQVWDVLVPMATPTLNTALERAKGQVRGRSHGSAGTPGGGQAAAAEGRILIVDPVCDAALWQALRSVMPGDVVRAAAGATGLKDATPPPSFFKMGGGLTGSGGSKARSALTGPQLAIAMSEELVEKVKWRAGGQDPLRSAVLSLSQLTNSAELSRVAAREPRGVVQGTALAVSLGLASASSVARKAASEDGLMQAAHLKAARLLRHRHAEDMALRVELAAQLCLSPSEQWQDLEQVLTQFGYLVLFGAAVPLLPLLLLANNLFEARSDALKLVLLYRRPDPVKTAGLGGVWLRSLQRLSALSPLFNIAIVLIASPAVECLFKPAEGYPPVLPPAPDGTPWAVRGQCPATSQTSLLIGVIVLEHIVLALRYFVAQEFDPVPQHVRRRVTTLRYFLLGAGGNEGLRGSVPGS